MLERAWRGVYRVGHLLSPLARLLGLRGRHGVAVAVWHAGRILVVRQSYRGGLTFPGGGAQAGEDPREAARRELREEVGIAAAAADLLPAHSGAVYRDNRGGEVRVFELHLPEAPTLRPDRREIVGAWFMAPEEARAAGLPRLLGLYLVRVERQKR
jgi:8-oxo-dGTP diphosphatase